MKTTKEWCTGNNRSISVSLRLFKDELEAVEAAAEREGLNRNQFLRKKVLQ